MRTPWDIARLAAEALAASAELQSFSTARFAAPLAVCLGGSGTSYEETPRPFAIVTLAGAEDGAKSADSVDLSIVVGIDSSVDPVSGAEADLTKPAPGPDGVLRVGRGHDLVLLAGLAADEAQDALPDCVFEKRAFRYKTGSAPLEIASVLLTIAPGIGFWHPTTATLSLNKPPQET